MCETYSSSGNHNCPRQEGGNKDPNATDFPYTLSADTKLDELQILKAEETKMIRPVDLAALNLLIEHDDVVAYINALMQVEHPKDNKKNSGSQPLRTLEIQTNIHRYKNDF